MTGKRFIFETDGVGFEVMDSWFGYRGDKEPTEREIDENDYFIIGVARTQDSAEDICKLLNEQHEEVMDLRSENTKFKLIVSEIIEDMQKYVDDNQLIYINQSYVDWIKKEVDTTLYSQKKELKE